MNSSEHSKRVLEIMIRPNMHNLLISFHTLGIAIRNTNLVTFSQGRPMSSEDAVLCTAGLRQFTPNRLQGVVLTFYSILADGSGYSLCRILLCK